MEKRKKKKKKKMEKMEKDEERESILERSGIGGRGPVFVRQLLRVRSRRLLARRFVVPVFLPTGFAFTGARYTGRWSLHDHSNKLDNGGFGGGENGFRTGEDRSSRVSLHYAVHPIEPF